MKVAQLYTYPIKSLRAHQLREARLTRHGFPFDRRFMLLQVDRDASGETVYKNMHVSHYSELTLFHPELHVPSGPGIKDGKIAVAYKPPHGDSSTIEILLEPDVASLEPLSVEMHKSKTEAYKMSDTINQWFSSCLGYEVVLAYLGPHYRSILMSNTPGAKTKPAAGWLTAISNAASDLFGDLASKEAKEITFADCAPYLVASERSMDDVSRRLPDGEQMDIEKFRPNIIVSGAREPWEEDYWAQITINDSTKIECLHNCARCVSINIDYATGKPGKSESGKMLAKLSKDRRIDAGAKYSPVFGRYSFLDRGSEGDVIMVGDDVQVTKVNPENTRFGV